MQVIEGLTVVYRVISAPDHLFEISSHRLYPDPTTRFLIHIDLGFTGRIIPMERSLYLDPIPDDFLWRQRGSVRCHPLVIFLQVGKRVLPDQGRATLHGWMMDDSQRLYEQLFNPFSESHTVGIEGDRKLPSQFKDDRPLP